MSKADEKATELGAEVQHVINWTWAKNFPTPVHAQEFIAWLETHGFEHRGYYPADPGCSNPNLQVDGVRYR